MTQQPITVAALNNYVSALLESDPKLQSILVRGEISGFRSYASGHLYFTLKDEQAAVSCVMFRGQAGRLKFKPADGQKVIVTAKASIYGRDGKFQLYVSQMTADGLGDLFLAFEQLKKKLEAEGLFDPARKRPLPLLPKTIGVVTSQSGAVIRDIINVLSRRFPNFRLQLIPVLVQGDQAAPSIARAIEQFNHLGQADVLIVGRGGGSMEDLWAFNEEIVARAVFNSQIPVISAVGHETDYTICDFVADSRAATPSVAAELAVPVKSEHEMAIAQAKMRLSQALGNRLAKTRLQLDHLSGSRMLRQPLEMVDRRRMDMDTIRQKLEQAVRLKTTREERRFSILSGKMDTLSPLKVLARGYGLVADPKSDRLLLSSAMVKPGDIVDVYLSDGVLNCDVRSVGDRRFIQ